MHGRSITCLRCGLPAREGLSCICGLEWLNVEPDGFFYRWERGEMIFHIRVPDGCLAVFSWDEV